jgi:uncharacterized membrane protein
MDKKMDGDSKNQEPETRWGALIFILFLNSILSSVLEIWMPKYLAWGVSFFFILIIAYPIKSKKYQDNFIQWCLRVFLYTALMMIALLILGWLFPKTFGRG